MFGTNTVVNTSPKSSDAVVNTPRSPRSLEAVTLSTTVVENGSSVIRPKFDSTTSLSIIVPLSYAVPVTESPVADTSPKSSSKILSVTPMVPLS